MTRHAIRTEADGTRVYSNGYRYKPKRPIVEPPAGAVRWNKKWLEPLTLVPEDSRKNFPQTRPDSEAYDHMPMPCACEVCRRPAAARWQRKWRRDHGLRA